MGEQTIRTVRVLVNGAWKHLSYNEQNGRWEGAFTAPTLTSQQLPGGYYPLTVEAVNIASVGTSAGASEIPALRLVVRERIRPTAQIHWPQDGGYLLNEREAQLFRLRDAATGSGVAIESLRLRIDAGEPLSSSAPGMQVLPVAGGFDVQYRPPTGLPDGQHRLRLDISDKDGNAAQQATAYFSLYTPRSLKMDWHPSEHYNAADLNRLEDYTGHLAALLNANGSAIVLEGRSSPWTISSLPRRGDMDRIRRNIDALRAGFYTLPDWRELLYNSTHTALQASAFEWNLGTLLHWVEALNLALRMSGGGYGGEV